MIRDLENKKILVLGAASMIGNAVFNILSGRGAVAIPAGRNYPIYGYNVNAEDYGDIYGLIKYIKPHYVYNGIGYNGGIPFNQKYPADIYQKTVLMNVNVLTACQNNGVEVVVSPLPSCSYSAFNSKGQPREALIESQFSDGPPHPSVECHGLAKRTIFDYSRQLYRQHKFKSLCPVLNNCYGPRDRFHTLRGKVVSSLITKFEAAKNAELDMVECYGDGSPYRELIYCEDAAEGLVRVLENYDDPEEVINIGTGQDVSILHLAHLIKRLTGFEGEIFWNRNYPNGQLKKLLSNGKMLNLLGSWANIELEEGLKRTIEWYRENKNEVK